MEPTPLNYASPPPADGGKKRKPILAWWGAIPVVLFAIPQGLSSWQVAAARGRGADFVAGYVTGAVFGGILLCLLLAWITYWISRKSQLASTIVFTVLMSLFSMSAVAMMVVRPLRFSGTVPPRPLMGPARGVAAPVRAFPSAGISVDTPSGWRQVPPDKPGMVSAWVGPGSAPGDVRQMIIIQAGKARANTIETANTLAARWSGRVVNDHVSLDGETACLIQAEPSKPGLQPVEGMVAEHEENVYLITGAVTPGNSCDAEFETIRQSWRWIPISSPALQLQFGKLPQSVMGGKVTLNYPAIMQLVPGSQPDRQFGIAVFDLRINGFAFAAAMQLTPLGTGATFQSEEERLATESRIKYSIREPLIWHSVPGAGEKAITQFVRVTRGNSPCWLAWALVGLDRGSLVTIEYQIYTTEPKDQAAYRTAAQKITESIAPGTR